MEFSDPQLPSIKHFRDVGKSINNIAKRQLLKEGVLFISSSATEASISENGYIRNTIGIRTVIDAAWESVRTIAIQSPQDGNVPQSWLEINRSLGLTYCGLKLRRGPYTTDLIDGLSVWQKTKLYGPYMLMGHWSRIHTLLSTAAQADGPTKESLRVLNSSKAMIGEVWNKVFSEETSYPILMTGVRDSNLMIMIVLLFLAVPIETLTVEIEQSVLHAQTGKEVPKDEVGARSQAEYVKNAGTWAADMKRWLEEKHGDVRGYLAVAGVSTKAQDAVERMLLLKSDEKLLEL